MEQICYALRKIHVPQILVTVLLLIYRYLVLMMKEADRITQAYLLRAPGEKGIRKSAWGSVAGQMLLRSMDRAQRVYESMTLRGFRGEFFPGGKFVPVWQSVLYGIFWGGFLAVIESDRAAAGQLQRKFSIGFNRAGRIIDQLNKAGVVGPAEGTKPRKILMTMEEFEQMLSGGINPAGDEVDSMVQAMEMEAVSTEEMF